MAALAKVRALWRLGPANLLRVGAYRALLKAGVYRRRLPIAQPLAGPFLAWPAAGRQPAAPEGVDREAWAALAQRVAAGELPAFSSGWVAAGFPPRWHRSVISGIDHDAPRAHWTTLPDFGLPGGDVKGYWEPARFDGLLMLGLGWLCTGRDDLREAIDAWLASWSADNPANAGLQWKCGQETGIRLMQMVLAVELLGRWGGVAPTAALAELVNQHARRIAPTMLYAVGQDNNHGTSEAAALFAAGAFLRRHGGPAVARDAARWIAAGRRWLDDRIGRLVARDGSFSQHSVNYHRVMLDTCSLAETLRRWHGLPAFGDGVLEGCRAATRWLAALTDPRSGDAPNIGANDGARLFVLHRQPYRDFRPSVQWASILFLDRGAYPAGPHDEPLAWLGLEAKAPSGEALTPAARLFPDGGYATLAAGDGAWALLRFPRFRFRPSHADALHLDLWVGGRNVLCDAGSYAYNADPRWLTYFSGTEAHNTVQFDGREQMPRVSRFLWGDWLETDELVFDADAATVSAAYRDGAGARHRRSVTVAAGRCRVVDDITGVRERAVLRWRLAPGGAEPACADGVCTDGTLRIAVRASGPITRFECVEGWRSLHYAQKTAVRVLEVEVHGDATLTTDIDWPS